ncbi:MAG TPA: M48 family metalloprotease [Steroidobacteraceae bacterium]|jgi:predicted Zn-dependent protease|nr:M48 family metalloprotease [Steroidobacteraceae bacterium]
MKRIPLLPLLIAATCVFISGCASNPATGGKNVVLGSMEGEKKTVQKNHQEIVKGLGLYDDQAMQEYVNLVGRRVALVSDLPNEEFKFFVIDDEAINAFTTGCCNVYVNRGLLVSLNSEAELAGVLGHEIGHVTARHPARRKTQGVAASLGALAAAVLTGSNAIGQLANIGAQAWMQGYGRDNEMEADRLGLKYMVKAGYNPESIGKVFNVFQAGEKFERQRATEEGREPRLYHGVFSSHPSPDERAVQAAKGAANIKETPPGGWIERHDEYLTTINGIAYGSSKAQGIVRDNRFYHSEMGITVAFPRGWTIENLRDRLLAFTPKKDAIMQVMIDAKPEKQAPREFLLSKLKGASVLKGEPLTTVDGEGYTIVTRSGSPIDNGAGPVRWAVIYRNQNAFIFAGASRSALDGVPEVDGLIKSTALTLRGLKPSEFPLAEPYRIKVVKATPATQLSDYAADMPEDKFKQETLELINAMYPKKRPQTGQLFKIVE